MSTFEKWSIWTTSALTAITGFGYGWTKYLLEPTEPWAAVNHPLQPWFLKAHIVVAPLLVFAVGLITVRHIWLHWRMGVRKGRRSGATAALMVAPMVLTGYLIQAVTHAGWLRALVIAHLATGVLYLAGLGLHQLLVGRRTEKRRAEAAEPRAGTCILAQECALGNVVRIEGKAAAEEALAGPGAESTEVAVEPR